MTVRTLWQTNRICSFFLQGSVIAKGERNQTLEAQDWGYLILLYILLNLVRAGLFFATYPLTMQIGLKTNWQETVFQVWGGLRGAVGVSEF